MFLGFGGKFPFHKINSIALERILIDGMPDLGRKLKRNPNKCLVE